MAGALEHCPITVRDAAGNALSGATVTITYRESGTPAIFYSDPHGETPAAQPYTSGALGRVEVWGPPGDYSAVVSHPALESHPEDFTLGVELAGEPSSEAHVTAAHAHPWVEEHAGEIAIASMGRKLDGTLYRHALSTVPSREDREGRQLYSRHRSPAGVVVLRFDDGYGDDISLVEPLLAARKLVGSFAVPSHNVGDTDFMTWADLRTLQRRGHEICSHGKYVDTAMQSRPDQFQTWLAEVVESRRLLEENEIFVQAFVQPGTWSNTQYHWNSEGLVDGTLEGELMRRLYLACDNYIDRRHLGIADFPAVRRYGGLYHFANQADDTQGLATLEKGLTALVQRGGIRHYLVHPGLLDQPGHLSVADFTTLLDEVRAHVDAGRLVNMTLTGSLYAQAGPLGNLLQDPSFELSTTATPRWKPVGSPTIESGGGQDGSNYARCDLNNYYRQVWSSQALRSVRIEAFARGDARDATARILWENRNAASGVVSSETVDTPVTTTWTKIVANFGIDGTVSTQGVWLDFRAADSNFVRWDDIRVIPI